VAVRVAIKAGLAIPPRAFTGSGYVPWLRGREAEAQAAFERALALDTDNAKAKEVKRGKGKSLIPLAGGAVAGGPRGPGREKTRFGRSPHRRSSRWCPDVRFSASADRPIPDSDTESAAVLRAWKTVKERWSVTLAPALGTMRGSMGTQVTVTPQVDRILHAALGVGWLRHHWTRDRCGRGQQPGQVRRTLDPGGGCRVDLTLRAADPVPNGLFKTGSGAPEDGNRRANCPFLRMKSSREDP
jgi:hypothetical protein